MKENSKLGVNSSKNSKGNSANLANSKPNSSPNSNLGSNLKAIFALPKWAKIFLVALTALATVGLGAAFSLKIWANDKIESGEIVLKSIDRGAQTRILRAENVAEQEIKAFLQSLDTKNATTSPEFQAKEGSQGAENSVVPSKFAYQNRLYFARLDFLLRSKVIAYIDIQGISWAESVDADKISGLKSRNRNVYFSSSQDFISQGFVGKNLGKVEYKMDFSPFVKTILKYYFGIAFFVLAMQILWNLFVIFWRSLPPKLNTQSTATTDDKIAAKSPNLKPLSRKDYGFLAFAFALCAGICAFTFWLGFPGFHIIGDTYVSIDLSKSNSHPVFISYVLQFLYLLFGRHSFYLFLFNIVPFYLGIFFLIAAFYVRFRSAFSLLLIFPTFIGNIYFQNFIEYHSFALPMMLFCLYSLLLFLLLVPFWQNSQSKAARGLAKFLWILLFILMFFAILWRHNAIFSVFPAFFVLCYLFLKNRNLNPKSYAKFYAKFTLLSAVLCLLVVIFVPKILTKGDSHPANHPFLHQIAAACVPENDASCFKDEWYYPHKGWQDVKNLYAKYPLNADPFNVSWGYDEERPFKHERLAGLKTQWAKSILKYPLNFLAHEWRFIKAMWWQSPGWLFDNQKLQKKASHEWHLSVIKDFPKNEQSVVLSPLRKQIYDFIFAHKFTLNHIVGVGVNFAVLLVCGVILTRAKWRENLARLNSLGLCVFAFSVGFAGFFSALFIAAFTPVAETRYMSPILPLAIVALVGFLAFVLECRCARGLSEKRV